MPSLRPFANQRSDRLLRFIQAVFVFIGFLQLTSCKPGETIYPSAHETTAGQYSYLTYAYPDFNSLVQIEEQILATSSNGDVWRSTDDGRTWGFDYSFPGRSIAKMTTDGKRIWAVGRRGEIFTSSDVGRTWQEANSQTDANITSVVITPGQRDLWAVGESGTVLFSSGDGEEWSTKKTGDLNNLTDVWASPDLRHIWVCGAKGTILRSGDAGRTWKRLASNTKQDLASIAGNDDGSLLLAAGSPRETMWSDDGGDSWHAVDLPEDDQITQVRYSRSEKRFYLSGLSGFLATTANGRDYQRETTSINRDLLGLNVQQIVPWVIGRSGTLLHKWDGRWIPSTTTSASFLGLHDLNTSNFIEFGFAGYVAICNKEKPEGPCQFTPVGTNKDIYAATATHDGRRLWVAGSHGLLAVREKGLWKVLPMDENLNIQAVAWNDPYLFIATYGSAKTPPKVMRSGDGGQTWETVLSTDKPLRTIAIHDLHGAVGGEKGAVFLTDDGGETWQESNSGSASAVYTVQREGGITAALGANGDLMVLDEKTHAWQDEGVETDHESYFASYCLDSCQTIVAVGSGGSRAISTDHGNNFDVAKVTEGPLEGIVPLRSKRVVLLTNLRETRIVEDVSEEWWDDAWKTALSQDRANEALLLNPEKGLMLVGGDKGRLILSENGGLTWDNVAPQWLGDDLNALALSADGTNMIAVGGGGTVLHSANGRIWVQDRLMTFKGNRMTDTLSAAVECLNKFWVAGRNGQMFVQDDAGREWRAIPPPEDSNETITSLACVDKSIWAARMDGTLTKFDAQSNAWLHSGQTISDDGLVALAAAQDVSGEMAALTTGGMLFLTKDSWIDSTFHYIGEQGFDVHISPDGNQIWAVGANGRITRSNDGGLSWKDNRGPTSADLHSVSINGYNVFITGGDSTIIRGRPNSSPPTLSYQHLDTSLTKWVAKFIFAVPTRSVLPAVPGTAQTNSEMQTVTLRGATVDFAADGYYTVLKSKQEDFFDGQVHSLDFKPPVLKGTGDILLQLCTSDPTSGSTCLPFATKRAPTIFSSPITYEVISAACLLILVAAIFVFRPITYLQIYQAPYVSAVLDFKLGGIEVIKPLISAIALPYLAFHRRSLKAWLLKYSEELKQGVRRQELMVLAGEYIPLPTRVVTSKVDTIILRPTEDTLLKLYQPEGTVIQITGPGGIGKTSLCKHLCELFLNREWTNSCPYPLIIGREFTDLVATVQQTLSLMTAAKVSSELVSALLREGMVQVVIDGVSEKSDGLRSAILTAVGSASVRQAVLTSRVVLPELQGRTVQCEPQPLQTDNLLFFIGKLVSDAQAEKGESMDAEQQLLVAAKISKMIRKGSETLPLTPLLAKLIVEKALRTQASDPNFDQIPATVPEAYLEYIRFIGTKTDDLTASDQVLRVAMIVAKASLGEDLVPAKVRMSVALNLINQASIANGESWLELLRDAGVLVVSTMQAYTCVAYLLDPLAEYLAAYSWAEEIQKNGAALQDLQERFTVSSFKGDGFRTALQLILQTTSEAQTSLVVGD